MQVYLQNPDGNLDEQPVNVRPGIVVFFQTLAEHVENGDLRVCLFTAADSSWADPLLDAVLAHAVSRLPAVRLPASSSELPPLRCPATGKPRAHPRKVVP
eukprot:5553489-Prymnesium_polylepis.2